jgi:hypothetical protein
MQCVRDYPPPRPMMCHSEAGRIKDNYFRLFIILIMANVGRDIKYIIIMLLIHHSAY